MFLSTVAGLAARLEDPQGGVGDAVVTGCMEQGSGDRADRERDECRGEEAGDECRGAWGGRR